MKKKIDLVLCILILFIYSCGFAKGGYYYPIDFCSEEHEVLLMVSQEPGDPLKLFAVERDGKAHQLIRHYEKPVCIQLLPDGSGISFIDQDRLRVQSFAKRSARSYDFTYPLHQLDNTVWSDAGHCFFTAKNRLNIGLFYIQDTQKDCISLFYHDKIDYTYPSCTETFLYFIERNRLNIPMHYSIKRFPIVSVETSAERRQGLEEQLAEIIASEQVSVTPLYDAAACDLLLDDMPPIMCLHMISDTLGWAIEIPSVSNDPLVHFNCYLIEYLEGEWRYDRVFTFSIPCHLFMGSSHDRLYESIRPLLPRFMQDSVYYSSTNSDGFLSIYRYDMAEKTSVLVSSEKDRHLFAPLVRGQTLLYGHTT